MRKYKDVFTYILVAIVAVGLLFLFVRADLAGNTDESSQYISSTENDTTKTTVTTQKPQKAVNRVALPDTIYGIVGKPLVIRFLNITEFNSLDQFSVNVETKGKGKAFTDRWEYTPTSAEDIEITFTVTDKQGIVVNESSHTIRIVDANSQKKEVSVLVIGDHTIATGYQTKQLLDLATGDGHELTLLGTKTSDYINDAQNRYEGRSGWRASMYVKTAETKSQGINPFYNPETKMFDFAYYMQTQGYSSVDCVCLQLGINDVFGARTDEALYSDTQLYEYLWYTDKIVKSIHDYDPSIKIVWDLISPGSVEQEKFEAMYGDSQTAERYKRNTYMANQEIIKRMTGMENIYIAPTNASLDTINNMHAGESGTVNPSVEGSREIGTCLYSFIMAITE